MQYCPYLILCVNWQVGDPKFLFEAKTIQRMELLVLSTLKWKMQALTPCSFIDYFLSKIIADDRLLPSMSSICRSTQLILGTIIGLFPLTVLSVCVVCNLFCGFCFIRCAVSLGLMEFHSSALVGIQCRN